MSMYLIIGMNYAFFYILLLYRESNATVPNFLLYLFRWESRPPSELLLEMGTKSSTVLLSSIDVTPSIA